MSGFEERKMPKEIRVDSVEIYKPGSNDELFQGIISDSEKEQGFVTFYDLEVEKDHEYFANGVLVHNCHHLIEPDKSYFAFVQDSFIPYRYGLTATLPITKSGKLTLESAIGPVISSYSINKGVEDGILAQPKVFMLVYGPQESYDRESYRFAYSEGIVKNKVRNKKIASLAKYLSAKGESVLIFVKEIPHGDNISEILKLNGVEHFWIHGSHKSDDRKATKKVIENKECLVGICSTIWNEGISINSLNNCIVAPGGKDPKAVIQIVGRGTRISEGKTSVKIWDFLDRGKHLGNHCFDRINTYNENGWKIIIPPKKVI